MGAKVWMAGCFTMGFLFVVAVLGLLGLNWYQYDLALDLALDTEENTPRQIEEITGAHLDEYLGKTVTVDGYFVAVTDSISLLVTSMEDYSQNKDIESNRYLELGSILQDYPKLLIGDRVYAKGRLELLERMNETGDSRIGMIKKPVIVWIASEVTPRGPGPDPIASLGITAPRIPNMTKYAILLSGGISSSKAYSRYWNDLKFMYKILTSNRYGYHPENIVVVYKNGIGEDNEMPVKYSAQKFTLQAAFTNMALKMTSDDKLFFFATNHGGPNKMNLFYGDSVTGQEFSDMVDDVTDYRNMIFVLEPCNSGSMIPWISGANRVILTAANASQSSWSADTEGNYDEFVYHFMMAVNYGGPNNEVSWLNDLNDNGRVSMFEAFIVASVFDSRNEDPMYDDDGDGIGHYSGLWGNDGVYGRDIYL